MFSGHLSSEIVLGPLQPNLTSNVHSTSNKIDINLCRPQYQQQQEQTTAATTNVDGRYGEMKIELTLDLVLRIEYGILFWMLVPEWGYMLAGKHRFFH